jgi:membrane-bound lytic murein transglycosylase D
MAATKTAPQTDEDAKTHTVTRGETLAMIAQRYHVSTDKLRGWNHLGRHARLKPGQKLKLEP